MKKQELNIKNIINYTEDSLKAYGSYVIENRALPDFRDGLKPVHRRIIWSMYKLKLWNNNKSVKTARVAGECFSGDTKITIDNNGNYKLIKDIKIGDIVLTTQGIKKVTNIFNNGIKPLYQLVLDNNITILLTKDQKIKIKRGGKFVWIEAYKLNQYCNIICKRNLIFTDRNPHGTYGSYKSSGKYRYDMYNKQLYKGLEKALTPKSRYKILHMTSFEYFSDEETYDIEVEDCHEFFANEINVQNCIGNYHPHGDKPVTDAITNLTNSYSSSGKIERKNIPVGLCAGTGNFGGYDEVAAAARYTEVKLSKYSENFLLNENYMPIIDLVDSYDGTKKEPVILPSLLPTLLLNGAQGIAVGVTTNIPPFHIDGVIECIKYALKKKITTKECLKYLKINYINNAEVLYNESNFKELYDTGSGKVIFKCKTKRDMKNKKLIINGITPIFNFSKLKDKLMKKDTIISMDKFDNSDDPINIIISLKSLPANELEKEFNEIEKNLKSSITYKTNVTIRKINDNKEINETDVDFKRTTIPNIINDWVSWRVELELKMLNYKKKIVKDKISYNELLRYAISKLDIIFKILKSKSNNLNKDLSKALKIKEDEAKIILDLQTRRLSKLSDDELINTIKILNNELKEINKFIKKPKDKILIDIKNIDLNKDIE